MRASGTAPSSGQLDIFALSPFSPTPGRVRRSNPSTSLQAAERISFKSGSLKPRILAFLAERGDYGANDWELHVHCDPLGRVHSASSRRKELAVEFGFVEETTLRRPTDNPKQTGVVHRITDAGRRWLAEHKSEAA